VVVEFGAQQHWSNSKSFPKSTYFQLIFKDQYKEIHSFDMIKEHDKVVQFDLRDELVLPYQADIITDMGTNEHVEGDRGQYQVWKNFHNACKKGGLMIHWLPEKNSWPNHCFYWYEVHFFVRLANANKYKLLELERVPLPPQGYNLWCALIKEEDNEFMSYEDFWKIW
jgi:hypothetical protein